MLLKTGGFDHDVSYPFSSLKPLVKRPGGKTAVRDKTLKFFPRGNYKRFIEPFVGGGAFLFHLVAPCALAADADQDLMAFYQQVKNSPNELYAKISELKQKYSVDPKPAYLRMRADFNARPQGLEKSALLIVLNKTCFNGLWRVNKKGEMNTPFGDRVPCPEIVSWEALKAASDYLRAPGVELRCADFRQTIAEAGSGDLVYADPPYFECQFRGYQKGGFGADDHRDLVASLHQAHSRGATVVASNSANSHAFPGFQQFITERRANIAASSTGRKVSKEYVYVLA